MLSDQKYALVPDFQLGQGIEVTISQNYGMAGVSL